MKVIDQYRVLAVCAHVDTAIKLKCQYGGSESDMKIKESSKGYGFCLLISKSYLKHLELEIRTNLDSLS